MPRSAFDRSCASPATCPVSSSFLDFLVEREGMLHSLGADLLRVRVRARAGCGDQHDRDRDRPSAARFLTRRVLPSRRRTTTRFVHADAGQVYEHEPSLWRNGRHSRAGVRVERCGRSCRPDRASKRRRHSGRHERRRHSERRLRHGLGDRQRHASGGCLSGDDWRGRRGGSRLRRACHGRRLGPGGRDEWSRSDGRDHFLEALWHGRVTRRWFCLEPRCSGGGTRRSERRRARVARQASRSAWVCSPQQAC